MGQGNNARLCRRRMSAGRIGNIPTGPRPARHLLPIACLPTRDGRLRFRGHDVLLFHVLDDQELDFDYSGTTKFEGLEANGDLVCDPRSLRDGYQAAMNAYLAELRKFCSHSSIDYQTVRTSEHLDAVLSRYLNHRIGMRGSVRR